MAWESELALAAAAAQAAGAQLRQCVSGAQTVLPSQGRDVKLQADCDAEALILKMLAPSGYGVLAEESGEHGDTGGGAPCWIVDPLDGTANFSRGVPLFGVSIALHAGGEPVLGVVLDVMHDICYTGRPGYGAHANGEPIQVSRLVEPAQGVLVTGFPIRFAFDAPESAALFATMRRFKKVRMIGTAALALAWVACGHADAYIEHDIMYWDVAAGVALVRAAGGTAQMTPSPKGKWVRQVRCAASDALLGV